MKSQLLLVVCIVCMQYLPGGRAIYVPPGDTYPGIESNPKGPKMLSLNPDNLRGRRPMKTNNKDEPEAVPAGPTAIPMMHTDEDDQQCSFTFHVPTPAKHQCGDGEKMQHMEHEMQEMKTCIDKLKSKTNVMFLMGMMKDMGSQDTKPRMMDMMMKMLDDKWAPERDDSNDKMMKMMKMMKMWMDKDDDENTEDGSEGGPSPPREIVGNDQRGGSKYLHETIEELKASVHKLKETMKMEQANFERFTADLEERLEAYHGQPGPPGPTGATGASGAMKSTGHSFNSNPSPEHKIVDDQPMEALPWI